MSTSKDTVAFIEDQLAGLPIGTNPMFGEYGMAYDDKVVGFICDDIDAFVRMIDRVAN